MQKTCQQCSQAFSVDDWDMKLYDKIGPTFGGKKYPVPPPFHCPTCRLQTQLAFRNERCLYKGTCDLCKKPMISIYAPDSPFTVYCTNCYWSDKWDALSYERNIDFSRSFLEQLQELAMDVPRVNLIFLGDNVNSDYTHDNYKLKNCYFVFDGEQGEDCYYGETFVRIKDSCDFLFLQESQLCYECVSCFGCYQLKWSCFCQNCSESAFLLDCQGCKNCIGCCNLVQKQYYIFNEPHSKEEYERKVAELKLNTASGIDVVRKQAEAFFATQPKKYMRGIMNDNVTGDNLVSCKDSSECFDCVNLRDCKYCTSLLMGATDCIDVNLWGDNMTLVANTAVCGAAVSNIIGCYYATINANDIYHSIHCTRGVSHLFGCIGVSHKSHCILNKQYTKEGYEKIMPKIIEHMQKDDSWGHFLPLTLSDFAYNETAAQDYFPLTKDEVLRHGWRWLDEQIDIPQVEKIIDAKQLPKIIADVPDDVLNWPIRCEETGFPYRIQKAELALYRTLNVPLPRKQFSVRHAARFAHRNPRQLWDRHCDSCKKGIRTTYSPDRPEKILCEECYQKAVY